MKTHSLLLSVVFCLLAAWPLLISCAADDDPSAGSGQANDDDDAVDDDATDDDETDDDLTDDDSLDDDTLDDDTADDDTADDDDTDPTVLWAVGSQPLLYRADDREDNGFFLKYAHGQWSYVEPPVKMGYMKCIHFSAPDHGLAADGKKLLRYDGALWSQDTSFAPIFAQYTIQSVFAEPNADWVMGYAAAFQPFAYRYAAGGWTLTDTSALPTVSRLKKPFIVEGELFAVLDCAAYPFYSSLAKYDAAMNVWNVVYSFIGTVINEVSFLDAETGMAAGAWVTDTFAGFTLYNYRHGVWSEDQTFPEQTHSSSGLNGVAMTAADRAVVVGYEGDKIWITGGKIFTWEDGQWTTPLYWEDHTFLAVRMKDAALGWVVGYHLLEGMVGDAGVILRLEKGQMQEEDLPGVPRNLWVLWDLAATTAGE
ncbi:MAG TPA: hypothetical protein PK961_01955 [bacterium]|nr:hypothetical protein [bacterium]